MPPLVLTDPNINAETTIIIAKGASVHQRGIAEELRSYLIRLSGAEYGTAGTKIGIGTDDEQHSGSLILLGRSGYTDRLGVDADGLGSEGFRIKRVDNSLVLLGANDIADRFAVYHFLEEICGVRWFWPGPYGEDVPEVPRIVVDKIDITETPDFAMRHLGGTSGAHNESAWSLRHKLGGSVEIQGVHAFGRMIPPDTYGPTNPEFFALVDGGMHKLTENPFISMIASFAISPLKLCTQSTLIMLEAVRNRIPVALSAAPMAGSTSPVTMAGTLAQLHAEQLAGIAICQLTHAGAPILYGGIPGRANLRSMAYSGGAVECGMMNAAIHQLAHHIKVPNYNSSGLSDSKIPDAQASWEKALTTVLAAMGGSNYVHYAAGMLESMLTVAYEQFVIDDEIIGMSCKVLDGIPVDDEHLALEAINEVGPGGSFITSPHTMKHMRQEYFDGNGVTDQDSRAKWREKGSQDARTRARDIVKRILAEEEKSCIPADVEKAIREKYNILL